MNLKNPLGLHIQDMDVVAKHTPGDSFYVDYARTSQLTTVTVLNNPKRASRLQNEAGVPYVVYREYKWEPAPPDRADEQTSKDNAFNVYQSARNLRLHVGNENVHLNVNCEQSFSPARFKMYTEMIRWAMRLEPKNPVGMVFGNAAIGTINSGFWGQPNDWEHPWLLEFLKTMDEYRQVRLPSGSYAFVLGVHNYTALYPWIAVNGGGHRVHNWSEGSKFLLDKAHIDWALPQDHLGREYQGIRYALGYQWDDSLRLWRWNSIGWPQPIEPPWYIVTESLIDGLNDTRWLHAADMSFEGKYREPVGYNSLEKTWARQDWFPGDSKGTTLAKFEEWAWQVVHGPTGYCIGTQTFCAGDTGGWDSHNVASGGQPDKDYFNRVGSYRYAMPDHFFKAVSSPTPVILPTPVDRKDGKLIRPYLVLADAKLGFTNLRSGPGTQHPIIGRVQQKQFMVTFEDPDALAIDENGKHWHYVALSGSLKGWVRVDLINQRLFEDKMLEEFV